MTKSYPDKQIEDLIDGKLPFGEVHRMLSSFKDPGRFDQYVGIMQRRVPWDDRILLPYGVHLFIVERADGQRVVKCDCGHDFGDYRTNWKESALINVRDSDESLLELYPPMTYCDPTWMELREFICPGCLALLEVEAVPPGYPLVFDFLPDLEAFYRDWLGREL
jgi:acetone carboxylase gamma subunit